MSKSKLGKVVAALLAVTLLLPTSGAATSAHAATASGGSVSLKYSVHLSEIGWENSVSSSMIAGRYLHRGNAAAGHMQAFKIELTNTTGITGGIQYAAHVQNVGWQNYVSSGNIAGTTGRNLNIEAVRIKLTGNLATQYDIYYRVYAPFQISQPEHVWLNWAKNGEAAGTVLSSGWLQSIQIHLEKKGSAYPSSTLNGATSTAEDPHLIDPSVTYNGLGFSAIAHISEVGDVPFPSAGGNTILGSVGKAQGLEAISLSLKNQPGSGIEYQAHVSNIGWQSIKSNGSVAGTKGQNNSIEAIRIRLTGELSKTHDVYYRAHVEWYGWRQGWTKNYGFAGTEGRGLKMEALQIVIVKKQGIAGGGIAPGS
jgi:uncharacterized protein YjdB